MEEEAEERHFLSSLRSPQERLERRLVIVRLVGRAVREVRHHSLDRSRLDEGSIWHSYINRCNRPSLEKVHIYYSEMWLFRKFCPVQKHRKAHFFRKFQSISGNFDHTESHLWLLIVTFKIEGEGVKPISDRAQGTHHLNGIGPLLVNSNYVSFWRF